MSIYAYIHISICMHMYIYINLLSLFSVAPVCVCMRVFIVDHLGMGSLSRGLSLENTESLSLSSYYLPVVLHLGVGTCKIFLIHINMSTGIVIVTVLFRKPCCWNFICAASLSYKEDTIFQGCSRSWSSSSYSLSTLSSTMFSESYVWGLCCKCFSWGWMPQGQLFSTFDQLWICVVVSEYPGSILSSHADLGNCPV